MSGEAKSKRGLVLVALVALVGLGMAVVVHGVVIGGSEVVEQDPEREPDAEDRELEPRAPTVPDRVALEPRDVAGADGALMTLVSGIVEVDGELVGLSSFEGEIERFTLEPTMPAWSERRVLHTGGAPPYERVLAARPLIDGHFELLLATRDYVPRVRVLDTRSGAERELTDEFPPVARALVRGDAFDVLVIDDTIWRVGGALELDGLELVEPDSIESFRSIGLGHGRVVRAESECVEQRCELVLTRLNLVGEIQDQVRREWDPLRNEYGLASLAAYGDVAPASMGAWLIFHTFLDDRSGYALVWADALEEQLEVTPLPIPDEGGPGSYFRFHECGDALWLLAIVHAEEYAHLPRLELLQVRPSVAERAFDLGEHQNLDWEHVRHTCRGESLSVLIETQLYEAPAVRAPG